MNGSGASLDLIFDTHALFWLTADHPRLSKKVIAALADPDTQVFVSAVTAWEYGDLHLRGRLPGSVSLREMRDEIGFELLDFPASAWRHAEMLPDLHRDPVDRMLVAHAIEADLTIATADPTIPRYPVRTLW